MDNGVSLTYVGEYLFFWKRFQLLSCHKNRVNKNHLTDEQRFGVPVFSNDRIVRIDEKPKNPGSRYAVTGLYMYDSTVFDKIRKIKPSSRGELEITDVNNLYIEENSLQYGVLEGPWLDAGTFDSLLEASNRIREMNYRLSFENSS